MKYSMVKDIVNVEEAGKVSTNKIPEISIQYKPAPFHRRIFANLIDILILALLFFLLFIGIRQIVSSSSEYISKQEYITQTRKESGLYIEYKNQLTDIVSYYSNNADLSSSQRKKGAASSINKFIAYINNEIDNEKSVIIQSNYDEYRLNKALNYGGVMFFVRDANNAIVENPLCTASEQIFFEKAYSPYIDLQCQSYLLTMNNKYYSCTKYISNMVLFIEIPISYSIAGLLTYIVPPLFFVRGRKTVGKALYQIGLIDSTTCLNISNKKFVSRCAILYFAEIILSLVTFGIPIIISFSLMAFSKKKQSFPDYMLDIQEIDTSKEKIYRSLEEISLENMQTNKTAIDFKLDDNN